MSEQYTPTIVPINQNGHTPEVILARSLSKVRRMKSVVVVIEWDDESWAVDYSNTPMSKFAMASKILDRQFQDDLLNMQKGDE